MTRIISITNQKGGVGKTTTAINLAAALALARRRTLLVDLDPQANATSGLGVDATGAQSSLLQAMLGEAALEGAIVATTDRYLSVVPGTDDLVGAELAFAQVAEREFLMRKALEPVRDRFEFILIDSPPSLGLLTVNALAASTGVVVPVQSEYYALEGLTQLLGTVNRVRDVLNPKLVIEGVLITMFDSRNNLAHQVEEEVRSELGRHEHVFQTVIPRNVRLSEAPSFGKSALAYDPKSAGAQAYLRLGRELMKRRPTA